MPRIKRIKLDVLKPHHPDILELASAITNIGKGYHATVSVEEIDEKTESVVVVVTGDHLDVAAITATIEQLGASLHSLDEVEVEHGEGM